MELVDEIAARDHLRGGDVFEGLALGGVGGVDAAPDTQEGLGLDELDRAADVRVGVGPLGDGVGLVGPQDVEPGCGGVGAGRDLP
ncbi:hypothetical protein AB0B79_39905 [Streptomyces sp. NPDC039022]|uniref:hypothetical protein n=1 Tax=unclassified Streptomyces TaxID=2593676 RepID=UPI00340E7E7C